jgi:lipopolysaccharide/colanic/teichoic acid biosynthesis glycosyltransferase
MSPSDHVIKRFIDIIISTMTIIVFSPIFLIMALVIKFTSRGPVFYRCEEVGKGGRHFAYYKFRTMVEDADKRRHKLSDKNEMTGPFFKMKNDPRVTPWGRIFRRFSLDELPQLWSVLKNDMSFVGPRPTQVFEFEQLLEWQKQRVKIKPGCVCLWHIKGKTTDFDEMVKLDLEYINNQSLWLDLKILFGAFGYIVSGKNC